MKKNIKYFNKAKFVNISKRFNAVFFNAGFMDENIIFSCETNPIKKEFIPLKKIIQKKVEKKYFLNGNLQKWKKPKEGKRIQRIKPNGEKYIYSEGRMTFPDSLDKPARTILTSESSVNRSTHIIEAGKGRKRLLTPIECERVNGFPDNWTKTGMPEKFRYFCMGNALVVPVVEELGREVTNIWKKEGENNGKA